MLRDLDIDGPSSNHSSNSQRLMSPGLKISLISIHQRDYIECPREVVKQVPIFLRGFPGPP
jgi:hypothetical protein